MAQKAVVLRVVRPPNHPSSTQGSFRSRPNNNSPETRTRDRSCPRGKGTRWNCYLHLAEKGLGRRNEGPVTRDTTGLETRVNTGTKESFLWVYSNPYMYTNGKVCPRHRKRVTPLVPTSGSSVDEPDPSLGPGDSGTKTEQTSPTK